MIAPFYFGMWIIHQAKKQHNDCYYETMILKVKHQSAASSEFSFCIKGKHMKHTLAYF